MKTHRHFVFLMLTMAGLSAPGSKRIPPPPPRVLVIPRGNITWDVKSAAANKILSASEFLEKTIGWTPEAVVASVLPKHDFKRRYGAAMAKIIPMEGSATNLLFAVTEQGLWDPGHHQLWAHELSHIQENEVARDDKRIPFYLSEGRAYLLGFL